MYEHREFQIQLPLLISRFRRQNQQQKGFQNNTRHYSGSTYLFHTARGQKLRISYEYKS